MPVATPVATHAAGATPIRLALAAMGTRFEIVLHGGDPVRLRAIGEAALAEIEDCHHRFTRFSPASLVSHIHQVAHMSPVRLDLDTFALFEEALDVHRRSGGAFDIGVAPVMDGVDGTGSSAGAIELDHATHTLRFTAPGVRLDLGGIAKGHALDLAARVVREMGVESALLHGGTSSVIGIGVPPGGDAWPIGLAQAPLAEPVRLRDSALSVSTTRGDAGVTVHSTDRGDAGSSGNAAGHLVDPRCGRRVTAARAVAVTGPSARLTDAWATAIAVLGNRPAGLGPDWNAQLFDLDAA